MLLTKENFVGYEKRPSSLYVENYNVTLSDNFKYLIKYGNSPLPVTLKFIKGEFSESLGYRSYKSFDFIDSSRTKHWTITFNSNESKSGGNDKFIVYCDPIITYRPLAEKFKLDENIQSNIQKNISYSLSNLADPVASLLNLSGIFSVNSSSLFLIINNLQEQLAEESFYKGLKSVEDFFNKVIMKISEINNGLPLSDRLKDEELKQLISNFNLLRSNYYAIFFVSPESVPSFNVTNEQYAANSMEKNIMLGEKLVENYRGFTGGGEYYNVWGLSSNPTTQEVNNALEMLKSLHTSLDIFLEEIENPNSFLYSSSKLSPPLELLKSYYKNLSGYGKEQIKENLSKINDEVLQIITCFEGGDTKKGFDLFQNFLKKVSVSKEKNINKKSFGIEKNYKFYEFINNFFNFVGRNLLLIPKDTQKPIMEFSLKYEKTDLDLTRTESGVSGSYTSIFRVKLLNSLEGFSLNKNLVADYIASAFKEVNPGHSVSVEYDSTQANFIVRVKGKVDEKFNEIVFDKVVGNTFIPTTLNPYVEKKESSLVYTLKVDKTEKDYQIPIISIEKSSMPIYLSLYSNNPTFAPSDSNTIAGKEFFTGDFGYRWATALFISDLSKKAGLNFDPETSFLLTFAFTGNLPRKYTDVYLSEENLKKLKEKNQVPSLDGFWNFLATDLYTYIANIVDFYKNSGIITEDTYNSLKQKLNLLFPEEQPNSGVRIFNEKNLGGLPDFLVKQFRYQFAIAYYEKAYEKYQSLGLDKNNLVDNFRKEAELYYSSLSNLFDRKSIAILSFQFFHLADQLGSYSVENATLGLKAEFGENKSLKLFLGINFLPALLNQFGSDLSIGNLPNIAYFGDLFNNYINLGIFGNRFSIGAGLSWEQKSEIGNTGIELSNTLSLNASYFFPTSQQTTYDEAILQKANELYASFNELLNLAISHKQKEQKFVAVTEINNKRNEVLLNLFSLKKLVQNRIGDNNIIMRQLDEIQYYLSDEGILKLATLGDKNQQQKDIYQVTVQSLIFCLNHTSHLMDNLVGSEYSSQGIIPYFFGKNPYVTSGFYLGSYSAPNADYGIAYLNNKSLFLFSIKDILKINYNLPLFEDETKKLNLNINSHNIFYLNSLFGKTVFELVQKSIKKDNQYPIESIKEENALNFLKNLINTSFIFNSFLSTQLTYSVYLNNTTQFNFSLGSGLDFMNVLSNQSYSALKEIPLYSNLSVSTSLFGKNFQVSLSGGYDPLSSHRYFQGELKIFSDGWTGNIFLRKDDYPYTSPPLVVGAGVSINLNEPKKADTSYLETNKEDMETNLKKQELGRFKTAANDFLINGKRFNSTELNKAYDYYIELNELNALFSTPFFSKLLADMKIQKYPLGEFAYIKQNEDGTVKVLSVEEILDILYVQTVKKEVSKELTNLEKVTQILENLNDSLVKDFISKNVEQDILAIQKKTK